MEPGQCSNQSLCCSSAEEGPLVGGCVSSPGVGKAATYAGSLSLYPAFHVCQGGAESVLKQRGNCMERKSPYLCVTGVKIIQTLQIPKMGGVGTTKSFEFFRGLLMD